MLSEWSIFRYDSPEEGSERVRWICGEGVKAGAEEGGEAVVNENKGIEVVSWEMVTNKDDEFVGEVTEKHIGILS